MSLTIGKRSTKVSRKSTVKITVDEDIKTADQAIALAYKERNTINELFLDGSSKPYPLNVPNIQLAKYGIGIYLYFEFVQRAALVFLFMAFISLVCMSSNYTGGGLDQHKDVSQLMKLSLANQPQLYVKTTNSSNQTILDQVASDNNQSTRAFVNVMYTRHLYVSLTDLAYSLVFMIFIIQFSAQSKKLIKESKSMHVLPSQFAVIITNFSAELIDPKPLKEFLSKYGEIYEVKFARNYHNTLFLHKEESSLTLKLKMEYMKVGTNKYSKSQIQKLTGKLADVKQNLSKVLDKRFGNRLSNHLKHDEYPNLLAFVIFETQYDRNEFISRYRRAVDLPFYNCLLGSSKHKISEYDLFLGQDILTIQTVVENPSDVKWENLEFSSNQRKSRLFVVFLLVFCLMIITFMIIFVANIVQPSNPDSCPQASYTIQQAKDLIQQSNITSSARTTIIDCFCQSQDVAALYEDPIISKFCSSTLARYTINTAIAVVSGFVILIVNQLLQTLLAALGEYPRYPSISKEVSTTMINIFVCLFINTALITLLLQADIFGFKPAVYISQPIPPLAQAQEDQIQNFPADLSRNWYVSVGITLINTWIINTLSPHLIIIILLPITRWSRNRKAISSVVQRQMNFWIVGTDFTLTIYYAQALNTIFVTMFYCSGMPLMLAFGSISLFLQLLSYKYFLLRFSRKPPTFDQDLHEKAMSVLPMALILHILIAIYAYGTPLIFPQSYNSISISTSSFDQQQVTTISTNQDFANIVQSRIIKTPWLTFLGVLIILYYIIDTALFDPIRIAIQKIFHTDNKISAMDDAVPLKYSNLYESIAHSTLGTYEIRANEHYNDIIQAMDMDVKSPILGQKSDPNIDEADYLIGDQQK